MRANPAIHENRACVVGDYDSFDDLFYILGDWSFKDDQTRPIRWIIRAGLQPLFNADLSIQDQVHDIIAFQPKMVALRVDVQGFVEIKDGELIFNRYGFWRNAECPEMLARYGEGEDYGIPRLTVSS